MERGHGGRLVDVSSLGMSVVDRHRWMEGREELWCSCIKRQEEKVKTTLDMILSLHIEKVIWLLLKPIVM